MRTGEKTARAFHQARPLASARQLPGKRGRRGFTLTEIMIAMGVLAVGMGMVAGALHAGIQTHIRTIDDIMRQLIGDNALAIVQASIRHSPTNGVTEQYQTGTLTGPFIAPANLKFPFNDNTSPYGAVVFIKVRTEPSRANDYNVLIMPYRIIPLLGSMNNYGAVTPQTLSSCTITTSGSVSKITVSAGNAQYLTVGAAVIDNANGQVSIVKEKDSSNSNVFVLWDKMTAAAGTATITTLKPPNGCRLECSKPVQTKTALSPDPMWSQGS